MTLEPETLPEAVTFNALLYGPPKNGKTAGAMTAPGGVCYLNADLPGRVRFGKSRDTENRVSVFKLPEGKVWETLQDVQRQCATEDPTWDTVVIDPVDDLYKRFLLDQSKRALRPSLPTIGDVQKLIERWCLAMCENQRINFVIVAHEFRYEGDGDGENVPTEIRPYTGTKNPALGETLMSMVDVIGYVKRVELPVGEVAEGQEPEQYETKYVAQLRDGKGRRGGDGFDVLATDDQPFRELNLSEWADTITRSYQPEEAAAA